MSNAARDDICPVPWRRSATSDDTYTLIVAARRRSVASGGARTQVVRDSESYPMFADV